MQKKLSLRALNLLSLVLISNGQKIQNQMGQEDWAPRSLNGEESAQRRYFNKIYQPIIEKVRESLQEEVGRYNDFVKKYKAKIEKKPKEADEEYQKRVQANIATSQEVQESFKKFADLQNEMQKKIYVIDLLDKTWDVVKKYWLEWGEVVGFMPGDDVVAEEIEKALC